MRSSRSKVLALIALLPLLPACTPPATSAPGAAAQSILASSTPANGSTVRGPVNRLELRFSPPARLVEVTVTGGDGMQTPMMVTAPGEVARYDLPLPGLEPGAYTVTWRATRAGTPHQGSFRFTVR
jgi:methionine-rich copper-binding protein CopC